MMRVGIGYDVHRLVAGLPLTVGGVRIEHSHGLEGHSDADVLIHAIMDALLGAAGLPDIGHHFPPGDERYRGASSLHLMAAVRRLLEQEGWKVANLDSTLVAESPRMAPHLASMKQAIGAVLGLSEAGIGIKATTNEGMGFLGRREGIAAMAVALIERAEVADREGNLGSTDL